MNKSLLASILLLLLPCFLANNITSNIPTIVTATKNYTSSPPTWITSPFFRAGQQAVITTFTGSSQFPFASYTFTYSSALPGTPNLAYGIQRYRGNDYLGQEYYQIRQTGLTATTFSVEIQIFGVTNLHLLAVGYLAVDPTFPHHLNSFDNVPINYTAGDIVNISSKSNTLTSYTNQINYTSQAAGRAFLSFTTPYTGNYIVIYITSLWIQGTFGTLVKFHMNSQVINDTHYRWTATLQKDVKITNVHFSQIIFNSDDVQASGTYFIVYQRWFTPALGGFLQIPIQFVDNFIMGVTDFQVTDAACGFEYQWEFANQTVNSVLTFGVQVLHSWSLTNKCGFSLTENSIFYMMTWQCDPPYVYFNITSRLCQTQCGKNTVESTTNFTCEPCAQTNCYQCDSGNVSNCIDCASYLYRELIDGQCVCINSSFATNSECMSCNTPSTGCTNCSYDDGANGTLPFNTALFTCLQCNNTLGYYLDNTTFLCKTLCGDGIFVTPTQGCDDGNSDQFDGCFANCSVQTGFTCSGSPSVCLYTGNVEFALSSQVVTSQSVACNSVTLGFGIVPSIPLLQQSYIAWDSFVTTPNSSSLWLNSSLTSYAGGVLSLTYFMLADLQGQLLTFNSNFSNLVPNSSIFSNSSSPSLSFTVNTSPSALMKCCNGFAVNVVLKTCDEVCGDGTVFDMQCDDGNLVNGDGCSENCTIQTDYACINGSATSPSVCSFNGTIDFKFIRGDKDPNKNSMTLTYGHLPAHVFTSLNNGSQDFRSWVSFPNNTGITISQVYIDPATNQMIIKVDYTQDLQEKDLTVDITPPNSPQAFAIPPISSTWNVQPTNQLPAVVYSDSDYQAEKITQIMANIIVGCYLVVLFLTMAYRKMIGLELATVIQMGYLSLLMNNEISLYHQPIADWKYVFGFNHHYFSQIPENWFSMPHHIYQFRQHFGYSNNVMLLVTLSAYLIAALLVILSCIVSKGTARKLKGAAFMIANDLCYTIMVFITPSILTAIFIQIKEGIILDWSIPWSKLMMILALLMLFFAHFLNIYKAKKNSDVGTFLKKKEKTAIYMPMIFNIRLVLLTLFLFVYHVNKTAPTYLSLIIIVAYITFVVLCRPHQKPFDLFRSLCLQIGLLLIFIMRIIEINAMVDSIDPRSAWFPVFAYLQYVIYIAAIVLSIMSFLYHIFKAIGGSNRVKNEAASEKEKDNIAPEVTIEALNPDQKNEDGDKIIQIENIEDQLEEKHSNSDKNNKLLQNEHGPSTKKLRKHRATEQ